MKLGQSVLNLWGVIFGLLLEALTRPHWSDYRLCACCYHDLLDRFHQRQTSRFSEHAKPVHEAPAHVTGRNPEGVRRASGSGSMRNISQRKLVRHAFLNICAFRRSVKCLNFPTSAQ